MDGTDVMVARNRAGRSIAAEASIVAGVTVGVSLVGTLRIGTTARAASAFTNSHLASLVAYELVLAAILLPWLGRRGWKPRQIAGDPTPGDVLSGVGLSVFAYSCFAVTWLLFAALAPDVARIVSAGRQFSGAPATAVVAIVASVVNPVFEEFLWLGYGVTRLAPGVGLRRACAMSVTLRAAVHLYQGPWMVVFGILPLGLAFTWYYCRTRRLWPVVVAHLLFDAIGLASRLAAR